MKRKRINYPIGRRKTRGFSFPTFSRQHVITAEKRMARDLHVDSRTAMEGARTQNWLSFALVVLLLADTRIFLPSFFGWHAILCSILFWLQNSVKGFQESRVCNLNCNSEGSSDCHWDSFLELWSYCATKVLCGCNSIKNSFR